MYTRIHILMATGVGVAIGAVAGYMVVRKQLEAKYAALYDTEIQAAKTLNAMFQKKDEFASPVKAAEALGVAPPEGLETTSAAEKLIQGLGYRGAKSVGTDALTRNRKLPYLIRDEEFFDNDSGLEQKVLMYFKGDDSLCDDADQLIEDVEATVGRANLDCFGQLSKNDNTCYVRNEKLRVEYEIVLDDGKYGEVVAGLTKED